MTAQGDQIPFGNPVERAKIAVMSNERDVDPVGACVGMKGPRVQASFANFAERRLILRMVDEPSVFAANALSPAKVIRFALPNRDRQMEVIVNEDQLSLAIGKRGRTFGCHQDGRLEYRHPQRGRDQNEVTSKWAL